MNRCSHQQKLLIETYCTCSWALANKVSNFNSNFLLNLLLDFFFKNVLTDNLLITDPRYKSTTVKDRGLRLFPMALRQKVWQPKENWPSGKMEHGNECKCQLFFDLYYAKILTVFPNGLGTSLQFHKLIPSSMNDPLQKKTRSLLFNKSHLTELIKCFLEEKHICQVQLDG